MSNLQFTLLILLISLVGIDITGSLTDINDNLKRIRSCLSSMYTDINPTVREIRHDTHMLKCWTDEYCSARYEDKNIDISDDMR